MLENEKLLAQKETEGASTAGHNWRRVSTSSRGERRKISTAEKDGRDNFVPAPKNQAQLPQKLEGKVAQAIEKAEQRKQKRLNRQKEV